MFRIFFILLAFLMMGCTSPIQVKGRMTPEEFQQANSQLSKPVFPASIELKVGEVKKLPKVPNTKWWGTNQTLLVVGEKDGEYILTGLKPGKAQFCGKNVYFPEFTQFVTVIVKEAN